MAGILTKTALLLALLLLNSCRRPEPAPQAEPAYADASVCATCHPEIADTYRRTGMGQSFFRPTAKNAIEHYKAKNT